VQFVAAVFGLDGVAHDLAFMGNEYQVCSEVVAVGLAALVYLVEGTDLLGFDEHDGLSKDGVHPTDYGYSIIANKLLPPVRKALGL
jgi:lysophospholipase L1-like esterase